MIEVPPAVRSQAVAAGASRWLDDLPGLVAGLAREWGLKVGRPYRDATEGFVLVVAVTYVGVNWLVDVLYGVIDPRVRV